MFQINYEQHFDNYRKFNFNIEFLYLLSVKLTLHMTTFVYVLKSCKIKILLLNTTLL